MPNNTLRKLFPLKISGYIFLFLLFYFILPIYSVRLSSFNTLIPLFLFYCINAVVIAVCIKKQYSRDYTLDSAIQDTQEKLNLLTVDYLKAQENNIALNQRQKRYSRLEKILENINQSLDLDAVGDKFCAEVFSLIGKNKGVCLLYLVDNQTQKLALFKSRKEDAGLAIKLKEGDIFDFWVIRHAACLLVEDVKNDFRFDPEKLKSQESRAFSSLSSAPFNSENKILGVIRLDNPQAHFFSQDDLRFLVSVADLGTLSIENSEFFQKTQDLAIHDALTSLYTKGYFTGRLKDEFRRRLRQPIPLSILMLDIDFFKKYNDRFGHTAGDIVLKRISRIIGDTFDNFNATISRFGGEEFSILLSGMDKKSAQACANSLREKIEKEKIILRRKESQVTVSIGVANFPVDSLDAQELLQLADKALYKAKQGGRNRVCCI